MAAKPILYSYFRSSASWRVRIALALKKIDYEYQAVHLMQDGGQQNTESYKALNPMGQVPALVIDGVTLTQSIPIIEYLEETRDGYNILPKDPAKRAQARGIAEIINSGIQPLQNLPVLQKIGSELGDNQKVPWAKFWIERGFKALEATLSKTAGKYCVGDEITLPDLCVPAQVYNAGRFNCDMSQFPTIMRVCQELEKHEAFKVAHPTQQPDCPEDMRQ